MLLKSSYPNTDLSEFGTGVFFYVNFRNNKALIKELDYNLYHQGNCTSAKICK